MIFPFLNFGFLSDFLSSMVIGATRESPKWCCPKHLFLYILLHLILLYFKFLTLPSLLLLNCRSATSFTRILLLGLQYFTLKHLLGFLGNLYMMIGLCCFSMLFLPLFLLYHLEYLSKMFRPKSAYRYMVEHLT